MKSLAIIVLVRYVVAHYAKGENLAIYGKSSGERSGRILASSAKDIKDNVAEALVKLDSVVFSVNNVTGQVETLIGTSLNASHTETLDKLTAIETALSAGGDLVHAVEKVEVTASALLDALTNSTSNATLAGQLVSLYDLLDKKLGNLEKIVGYDDYPTTTVATTTTSQAATTTSQATTTTSAPITTSQATGSDCNEDADCSSNPNGPLCTNQKCGYDCVRDNQCKLINATFTCNTSTGKCG